MTDPYLWGKCKLRQNDANEAFPFATNGIQEIHYFNFNCIAPAIEAIIVDAAATHHTSRAGLVCICISVEQLDQHRVGLYMVRCHLFDGSNSLVQLVGYSTTQFTSMYTISITAQHQLKAQQFVFFFFCFWFLLKHNGGHGIWLC